jgi:hypothetical protein
MVDKKDKKKKKKIKKTETQNQKKKQSVSVVVNVNKPAGRRRTLAKKTSDNRPLPPTPQSYGIPVQQSTQPTLNNITDYLRKKEGQDNNRHVNILSAMNAIQRAEGVQMSVVQTEKQTDKPPPKEPSPEPPQRGRPRGTRKTDEEKEEAAARRLAKSAKQQDVREDFVKTGETDPKAAKRLAKSKKLQATISQQIEEDFIRANPTNPTGDLGPTRDIPTESGTNL